MVFDDYDDDEVEETKDLETLNLPGAAIQDRKLSQTNRSSTAIISTTKLECDRDDTRKTLPEVFAEDLEDDEAM